MHSKIETNCEIYKVFADENESNCKSDLPLVGLNDPNAKKNEDRFDGKTDFLAKMSPPSFQASPALNASDFVTRGCQAENSFEYIEMEMMVGHSEIWNESEDQERSSSSQSLVNNEYVENSNCEIFYSAEEQF